MYKSNVELRHAAAKRIRAQMEITGRNLREASNDQRNTYARIACLELLDAASDAARETFTTDEYMAYATVAARQFQFCTRVTTYAGFLSRTSV
jgi:hypothetical protein